MSQQTADSGIAYQAETVRVDRKKIEALCKEAAGELRKAFVAAGWSPATLYNYTNGTISRRMFYSLMGAFPDTDWESALVADAPKKNDEVSASVEDSIRSIEERLDTAFNRIRALEALTSSLRRF